MSRTNNRPDNFASWLLVRRNEPGTIGQFARKVIEDWRGTHPTNDDWEAWHRYVRIYAGRVDADGLMTALRDAWNAYQFSKFKTGQYLLRARR